MIPSTFFNQTETIRSEKQLRDALREANTARLEAEAKKTSSVYLAQAMEASAKADGDAAEVGLRRRPGRAGRRQVITRARRRRAAAGKPGLAHVLRRPERLHYRGRSVPVDRGGSGSRCRRSSAFFPPLASFALAVDPNSVLPSSRRDLSLNQLAQLTRPSCSSVPALLCPAERA